MTIPYTNPAAIHDPATAQPIPAAWGDAVNAGIEYAVNPPGCVVSLSNQSIPNITQTSLVWNLTDLRDTDNFHAANASELTISANHDGWYLVTCKIRWEPSTFGLRNLYFHSNYSSELVSADKQITNQVVTQTFSTVAYLPSGPTVSFSVSQTSGAALSVYNAQASLTLIAKD